MHHISHQLHLDLKPENLLIKSPLEVKISDLGISTKLEHTNQNIQKTDGTFRYMSPERLQTCRYSFLADIWSAGIIVFEMVLTHYPFKSHVSYIELLQFFKDRDCVVPNKIPGYSPLLVDFLKKALTIDHTQRPSSIELLAHPWILKV